MKNKAEHIEDSELEDSIFQAFDFLVDFLKLKKNLKLIKSSLEKSIRDFSGDPVKSFTRTAEHLSLKSAEFFSTINDFTSTEINTLPIFTYSRKLKKWLAFIDEKPLSFKVIIFSKIKKVVNINKNNLNDYFFTGELISFFTVSSETFFSDISQKTPFKRLIKLTRGSGKDIAIIIAYSIIIGSVYLVIPIVVQSLVNSIAFAVLMQPLFILTFFVLLTLGFAGIARVIRTFMVEVMQRRVFVNLSLDLTHKIPKVSIKEFDKNHGPELVNRFFDILTVQKSFSVLLIDGLTILMQSITGMVLLAFYHPFLLAFDLLMLLVIIFILFFLSRGAVITSINESKMKYKVAAWLEEIALNVKSFKDQYSRLFAFRKSDSLIRQYIDYRSRHFRVLLRIFIGSVSLQILSSVLLLSIGGFLVMKNQLSVGQLVAAEIIVTLIADGFVKFGKQLEFFYDLLASIDKLGSLTDLETDQETGVIPSEDDFLTLTVDSGSFSFNQGIPILKDINLKLDKPEKILIIGRSSSGKSTLLELIYAIRSFSSGIYEINGLNIKKIDKVYLRDQIFQIADKEIFEGTIAENIRLGRTKVSDSEILKLISGLHLGELVRNHPDGIDLKLSTGGSPLSNSLCFELLLVRALISSPKVLLLDSILEYFDQISLENILKKITEIRSPLLLIATSVSENYKSYFDRIFILESGMLREIDKS